MNRIRWAATTLGLAGVMLVLAGGLALAQETSGRVVGRVVDQESGAALAGVTVIAQGPQGEDATITDDAGTYSFTGLPAGVYTIRYYLANTSTQVEQPNVKVSAEKTVRVNAKIATTAQAAAQQTYVITGKAPAVDVGSARIGSSFDQDFTLNLPIAPNYGAVLSKAPGVFVDPSGNVSIGGATGLENTYVVNGVNVTGLRYGNLEVGQASIGGGTNLPTEFLEQIDVNQGGYQAEFGGALGGVVNTVLKRGTNEWHGSVFASSAPYWLAASPATVTVIGSSIAGARKLDFDDRLGFTVGGPLVKDKLFLWLGMAPQISAAHIHRYTYAFADDGMGGAKVDAAGNPIPTLLPDATRRLDETHRSYSYAATLNFTPAPEHKLELAIFGTPGFNNQLRSFGNGQELNAAFPTNGQTTWAQESLTKSNTDVTLHWTSKLFDRKWQVEAIGALHNEYFFQRSPSSALNGLNQIEYFGSNLSDLEQIPGCEPTATGFQPCPVNPFYSRGGFGTVQKYTGNRWSGELKATNSFEAGGRHDLKYGLKSDLTTLDLERYYSGPPGARGLTWFDGNGLNTQNFFGLGANQYPGDFGDTTMGARYPNSDLVQKPLYKDQLNANVKSTTNAVYLQDTFSPAPLRNLSLNAGVRYEKQTIYDTNGVSFLSTDNIGPRFGVVYDPFNDGRSKISAGFGRFFQAIPLDVAARYFGGENYVDRFGIPPDQCANSDKSTWTGAGEWRNCSIPKVGETTGDVATGGYSVINNTAQKQTHIKGQYQNEIVATFERELMEDLSVRLDYTHRWLDQIIEDGYGDGTFTDVLGNPGNVPGEALDDAKKNAATLHADADTKAMSANSLSQMAMADPTNEALATQAANAKSAAADASSKAGNADNIYTTLQGLAKAPKPERKYDALSLSVNKRFSKNWLLRASYTYSRLVGNYEGLYQVQNAYYAPNGANAYDTADLLVNSRGLLPNDHPHQGKVDGFYSFDAGPGKVTFGLSFVARSGMPRNYYGNLIPGTQNQLVNILPRGTAGRTPMLTQLDSHIAYAQQLQKKLTLEVFIDLFNVFDQKASLIADDNYTFNAVAPIENGTAKDLAFAKAFDGSPVQKNPNFGRSIGFQAPFYTRLGARLLF